MMPDVGFSKRFRKGDWLALGLAQLVAEGAAGLTVERLCEAARRTRGSFYHHFADHDAFLRDLLARWRTLHTDDVIAAVEAEGDGPNRPQTLHDLAIRLDHKLDLAIRRFAYANPIAAEQVRAVDDTRLGYLTKLYRETAGTTEAEASALARLEYAAFVGAQILWPDADLDRAFPTKELFARVSHAVLSAPRRR